MKNEKVRTEGNYRDGKREGIFKTYYENTRLQEEALYKDGKLEGVYKKYYENGKLWLEMTYKDGKREGICKRYYEHGQLKEEMLYKDEPDGQYTWYHENGQLEETGIFKNGKREGICKLYHENGQVQEEGLYRDGKKEGLFKGYYANGNLQDEGFYKNGTRDGVYKLYFMDGRLKKESMYKDGNLGQDWILEAISFAARKHDTQMRKDNKTPYISHPFRVVMILSQVFGVRDEKVLAAAVLHDTIEDTCTDFDEIEKKFGSDIASWVKALSKDVGKSPKERDDDYAMVLAQSPDEVKLIKLADMYDNLKDAPGSLDAQQLEKTRTKVKKYLQIFGEQESASVLAAIKQVIKLLEVHN